ncbi:MULTISPECIES: hypothetical protein [Sphingobium]|uniref:hypothetical protein n=1 Tax=Sphingobium TaxID=165695 RepID=UPI000DBB9E54|nr:MULTISPECIES: hypothetical protein [Sphingobium]BBD03365.1 hypothetical protein YGS_C2P1379 [Sphingobium sp. YG1]
MPKMNDRERLAKLMTDQQRLSQETQAVRRSLRAQYGALAADMEVETLTEREFRDLINEAIRVGGPAAIAALKALSPTAAKTGPAQEQRPRQEHGVAVRRRPATPQGAASPGDGTGL